MLGSSNTSVGIDPATSSVSRLEDVDIRDIIGGDKDLDDFFKVYSTMSHLYALQKRLLNSAANGF